MGAIVSGMLAVAGSSPRHNLARRLDTVLASSPGFETAALVPAVLRPKKAGRVPIISTFLEGRPWTEEMAMRLERADVNLTVSEFVCARIFLALLAALVLMLFLGVGVLGATAMAGAGFAGYRLPSFYVSFAQGRRVKRLNDQLVEALSLISNSLKAGFGLMQSLDLASKELHHPLSTELRRSLHDINIGSSTDDALQNLARRSGSDDFDIVITAMLIQQSTGGNLAEILDNVGHTMRERIRIRGEIKTLTTQQLLTGFIIGGMPVVMIILFSLINPGYMTPLLSGIAGNIMLIGAGMLETFGILLIKKILAIEV